MNQFKGLIALIGLLIGLSVSAEISPLPEAPKNPLSEMPRPFPKITCANLNEELGKLKSMSNDHNQAVAGFMDDVITTMNKWHERLLVLEGKEVDIPVGEFNNVQNGQKQIGEAQAMVWDNMGTLETRFDEVLEVLPSCMK